MQMFGQELLMSTISRRTFLWLTGGSGIALATTAQRKAVNN